MREEHPGMVGMTDDSKQSVPLVVGGHELPPGMDLDDAMQLLRRKVAAGEPDPRAVWVEWWCSLLLDFLLITGLRGMAEMRPPLERIRREAAAAGRDSRADVDDLVSKFVGCRAMVAHEVLYRQAQVLEEGPLQASYGLVIVGAPARGGRHEVTCSGCGQSAVVDDLDLRAGLVTHETLAYMEPPEVPT